MSGFSISARWLRARVLVEAAPVDGLGAEVEAALDLDAVDVEAVARLDVGALLALEIGVLDRVDLVRAGRQIPGGLARRIEPGLADRREGADRLRHHAGGRGGDALGETVEAALTGVFDVTKIGSQAWSAGAKIYWDDTNKRTTNVATSNTLIGVATEAVAGGAGDTVGRVRLNGAF